MTAPVRIHREYPYVKAPGRSSRKADREQRQRVAHVSPATLYRMQPDRGSILSAARHSARAQLTLNPAAAICGAER